MNRRHFHRLVAAALPAAASPAAAEDRFRKVLFLGNSITRHGPKADIDWTGDWGMAASAAEKDYVHLVVRGLAAQGGAAPEVMVRNIADFERGYAGYDAAARLRDAIGFEADLLVLAIGENVPALKTSADRAGFQAAVASLLAALTSGRGSVVVVRGGFWSDAAKDGALKQACAAAGGIFVDLGALGKDERNYARSERPFKHAGVANHPGDQGMAAIAAAILAALPRR